MGKYVGRLAPSPTGALHLGNIRTFLIAYLRARSLGGKVLLRIEDLDPRSKPDAVDELKRDLADLGFTWDAESVQSERLNLYRAALEKLRPFIYPCVCTRRDVEAMQSAPHEKKQLRYPGTCRDRFPDWASACAVVEGDREPVWRFRVPEGTRVAFEDVFAGRFEQDVAQELGDFPLARGADGASYTLASVVDDLASGVTEIVRGDDLLPATPAQILVARRLSGRAEPFAYLHVPLVVGPDGKRLAKRHGDTRLKAFRAAGWTTERILGALAASCGWCPKGTAISMEELLGLFTLTTIPRVPWVIPQALTMV